MFLRPHRAEVGLAGLAPTGFAGVVGRQGVAAKLGPAAIDAHRHRGGRQRRTRGAFAFHQRQGGEGRGRGIAFGAQGVASALNLCGIELAAEGRAQQRRGAGEGLAVRAELHQETQQGRAMPMLVQP